VVGDKRDPVTITICRDSKGLCDPGIPIGLDPSALTAIEFSMRYKVSGLIVRLSADGEVVDIVNPEGHRCASYGSGFTKGFLRDYCNSNMAKLNRELTQKTNEPTDTR